MNILQLTTRLRTGGISRYIETLASGLMASGHEVKVVAHPEGAEEALLKSGIPFIPLDLDTKFAWHPKLFSAEHFLDDLVQSERFDIIHAHTRVSQMLALRVSRRLNIPAVSTCHGFYRPHLGRLVFPGWGDRVIAISPEVGGHLADKLRVPGDKITVIVNGLDTEKLIHSYEAAGRVRARAKWGIGRTDTVLGMTARIERVKGHEFAVEALAVLAPRYPKLKLLIAGRGSDERRIASLVERKRLFDRVIFTGDLEDITTLLAAVDVFVAPQIWQEGFGLAVAEAMVCGVPVVASETGAVRRYISNGKTGILVPPGDARLLAQAIGEIMTNSERRESVTAAARAFAREAFSKTRFTREVEGVYRDVLGKHGANEKVQVSDTRWAKAV